MELKQKVGVLKQIRYLRGEVDQLSQRIAGLDAALQAGTPRAAEVGRLWRARRLRCMEQLGALYAWIDDIDDSLMRQIVSLRYIDGRTWQQVAESIGERDEQYPRRLHNRWLASTELPAALTGEGRCGAPGSQADVLDQVPAHGVVRLDEQYGGAVAVAVP